MKPKTKKRLAAEAGKKRLTLAVSASFTVFFIELWGENETVTNGLSRERDSINNVI